MSVIAAVIVLLGVPVQDKGGAKDPSLDVEVGFRGRAFADSWVPIVARVRTAGAPFRGEVVARIPGRFGGASVRRQRLSLAGGADRRIVLEFFAGGAEMEVQVALVEADGRTVARASVPLEFAESAVRQMLMVGEPPRSMRRLPDSFEVSIARVEPGGLPRTVASLGGLDVIVLPEPVPLESVQAAALRQWVDLGGRLVVFAGQRAPDLKAGALADLLPVDITGADVIAGGRIAVATGPVKDGRVFLSVEGRPVGVRASRGRGEVVFLAFSLQDADDIESPRLLWGRVLEVGELERERERDPVLMSTPTLFERMAWSMVGVSAAVLGAGAALAFGYLLLIGPVDYLLLRRRRRFRWAWLHLFVCAGALSAVFLVMRERLSPSSARVWHVVFEDHGDRTMALRTFSCLQADIGRDYVLTARDAATVSWLPRDVTDLEAAALPETSVEDGSRLRLPMPARTTQSFHSMRAGEAQVWCRRTGGTIEVDNLGPRELRDCLLVTNTGVHELGTVERGARRAIDVAAERSMSFDQWAGRLLRKDKERRGFWFDAGPADDIAPEQLPLALSFYAKVRPILQRSTAWRSPPRYVVRQRGIDLSGELARGRAVFVARIAQDDTGFSMEGAAVADTRGLVRVVLP